MDYFLKPSISQLNYLTNIIIYCDTYIETWQGIDFIYCLVYTSRRVFMFLDFRVFPVNAMFTGFFLPTFY